MSASGFVFLEDVWVVNLTEKAAQILYRGKYHWIPRSQIAPEDETGLKQGSGYTIGITEWIAKQRGIET